MKSIEIDRSKRLIDQPKTGHNRLPLGHARGPLRDRAPRAT
jgi:hypothetical protein